MSMIDTPLMRGLERVLDVSAFRHQIIAANLANIDTPGYRTRDLRPFAGEIERAMAGKESSLSEASLAGPSFTLIAYEIRGLRQRRPGNSACVQRESL